MTAADHPRSLEPYLELVADFVEGRTPATDFQYRYSRTYLNDPTGWTDEEFAVLDTLFGDVDSFEADPNLRAEVIDALDEPALRSRAAEALAGIRRLAGAG
jgi:hypothetical protein